MSSCSPQARIVAALAIATLGCVQESHRPGESASSLEHSADSPRASHAVDARGAFHGFLESSLDWPRSRAPSEQFASNGVCSEDEQVIQYEVLPAAYKILSVLAHGDTAIGIAEVISVATVEVNRAHASKLWGTARIRVDTMSWHIVREETAGTWLTCTQSFAPAYILADYLSPAGWDPPTETTQTVRERADSIHRAVLASQASRN